MADLKNAARQASLMLAEKYCQMLLGQISSGHRYMRILVLAGIVVGIGAAFLFKDLKSLLVRS